MDEPIYHFNADCSAYSLYHKISRMLRQKTTKNTFIFGKIHKIISILIVLHECRQSKLAHHSPPVHTCHRFKYILNRMQRYTNHVAYMYCTLCYFIDSPSIDALQPTFHNLGLLNYSVTSPANRHTTKKK